MTHNTWFFFGLFFQFFVLISAPFYAFRSWDKRALSYLVKEIQCMLRGFKDYYLLCRETSQLINVLPHTPSYTIGLIRATEVVTGQLSISFLAMIWAFIRLFLYGLSSIRNKFVCLHDRCYYLYTLRDSVSPVWRIFMKVIRFYLFFTFFTP